MVRQRIVLGHEISRRGIKVDKVKIELIAKLHVPKCVRDILSFLGHAGFYGWFIKDFSKIARPLTNFLSKDVPFNFNDKYFYSWKKLKKELISTPLFQLQIGRNHLKSCVIPLILLLARSQDSVSIIGNT